MTVPLKSELMRTEGGGGGRIPVQMFAYKAYPDHQIEKEIHKWAGIVVKRGKKIRSCMKRLF